jgi:predicted nucleic acid-binding protein
VERVFADTNVLFPFSIMDLLLTMAEDGIHEFLWSDDLLDEWERVITASSKRSAASAAAITGDIRRFFRDGEIERSAYAHDIDDMPSPDPDDRKHIAAAKAGGASVLLTKNARDFPASPLLQMSIRVLDVDAYLCEQLAASPEQMLWTATRIADEKRRPSMTLNEWLDAVERAGAPEFVARLRGSPEGPPMP